MTRILRNGIAVLLLLLAAGCGQKAGEPLSDTEFSAEGANASQQAEEGEMESAQGASQEAAQSDETVWEVQGSGTVTEGEALTEGQKEIMLAFMDTYYQSLGALTVQDCSHLFVLDEEHEEFSTPMAHTSWSVRTDNRTQAAVHHAAWNMVIGMRELSNVDLHILSYDCLLECQDINELDDGCVQVEVMEYTDMRFAQTPDIDSSVTGVWHSFVMKEVDGEWYLTHHAAYDSSYFTFLRWGRTGTTDNSGSSLEEEFARLGDERVQEAKELIELRWQQADSRGEEPTADHPYDREAAVAYGREWADKRNPEWQAYDGLGGNCMNYVSQCLYVSGIPMDQTGDDTWYWYSGDNRAPAWTGVSYFREYIQNNTGYGLSAQVGAPYQSGEIGDVILMSSNGRFHHAVLISQVVKNEEGEAVDYLICSNTGNYRDFPVSAYMYQEQELVKIAGWNE